MNEVLANEEMPNGDPAVFMNKVAKWGTIIGGVLCTLGLFSLLLPTVMAIAIEIWLAVTLLCVGASLLALAFQNRGYGSVAFEAIWGTIYVIAGLALLLMPMSGVITIALILGVVFILDGIGRIIFASQAFATERKVWWIFDGVVAILLGGIILANWPGDSAWIVGVLVGLRLLFTGAITILVSSLLRK
ncbi:HdeD family acid-resistance protein [Mariniblastus fucicola]|uniref:Acid-resistance membrane protein n=1 Tax=Mariniblastus fucicola TaxID=980251 RepID=A0A5B9PL41_9BACT|nr:DUF308 domain-containing protein [Mariniblastus fucicola]QEG23401.1 acid-resistance membrane protein [Mariniblastus fucicola]